MIGEFRGPTRWLSNFAKVTINYRGLVYMSTEAAYQGQKTLDFGDRVIMSGSSPSVAKEMGMKVTLREDWDTIKLGIMYDVNLIKFQQEPFKSQLLATGDQDLVEGNDWGDRYWGVCSGVGENNLGKILMRIREELRNESVQAGDSGNDSKQTSSPS